VSLPEPERSKRVPRIHRPIVWTVVLGGGAALMTAIIGLVVLGINDKNDTQIALTGLASIGATLSGAFAGWLGSGSSRQRKDDDG
jgi:ABC-type Fe3+ transport system permease subunit